MSPTTELVRHDEDTDRPDTPNTGNRAPARRTTRATTPTPRAEPNRRLVVELNSRTAEDLAWLVDIEELNKTNLVNRAVQVYRLVVEAQHNGGGITIDDPARRGPEKLRLL